MATLIDFKLEDRKSSLDLILIPLTFLHTAFPGAANCGYYIKMGENTTSSERNITIKKELKQVRPDCNMTSLSLIPSKFGIG